MSDELMATDLKAVRAFEADLDAALNSLPMFKTNANECLRLLCNTYELARQDLRRWGAAGIFSRGTNVLARFLVSGVDGPSPDIETIVDNAVFASHYYLLRDYFYFTYNAAHSMTWQFTDDRVEIRFADPTIPRQYYTEFNNWIIDSRDLFADFDSAEVQQLLQGESEFVMSANIAKALDLIEKEAKLKLGAYFSVIYTEREIDLGGYTYQQFITVYRALLVKALYHRYFTRVNGGGGAVHFQIAQILDAVEAGMPRENAAAILRDLVFDAEAAKQRTDPSYFSLLQEGAEPRNVWMRPHEFAMSDGLVDHLKIVAHRRPQLFLNNVSDALGRGFARTVEETFSTEGFTCHANVPLREFGSNLPDIDLIAIAAEPTLGYVLFICELKGMIPAGWAKDRLRVLNEGGVAKAFAQIEAVNSILHTDDGLRFIRKLLPAEGMPPFDGFVAVLRYLIITSSSAGMFFGNESIKVSDQLSDAQASPETR